MPLRSKAPGGWAAIAVLCFAVGQLEAAPRETVRLADIEIARSQLDFGEECVGGEYHRSIVLRNTGAQAVRIFNIEIDSSAAPGWFQGGPIAQEGVLLQPAGDVRGRDRITLEVVFTPQTDEAKTVRLRFALFQPGGTLQTNVKGKGKDCSERTDDTGTPDTGAEPGTAGPGDSGPGVPKCELCIAFHIVTPYVGNPPTAEQIDAWLTEVNRIWSGTGVTFKREGPPDTVKEGEVGQNINAHCALELFLCPEIPGDTAGRAWPGTPLTSEWSDVKGDLPANDTFERRMGAGESAKIEVNESPEVTAQTIAHELGHLFGLAPSSSNLVDDHLDPGTGMPITESNRLMHPKSSGTELTDLERQVLARVAAYKKSGGVPCDHSRLVVPEDPQSPAPRYCYFDNLEDRFRFSFEPLDGLDPARHDATVSVSFDADQDGVAEVGISYSWDGELWQIESFRPAGLEVDLPQPWFTRGVDGGTAEAALELIVEIPRAFVPDNRGVVQWRAAWFSEALGVAHAFPAVGFESMDLTPVTLAILPDPGFDLPAGIRQSVSPGDRLEITGDAFASSTYSGAPGFWGRLWDARRVYWFDLGVVNNIAAGRWAVQLDLPPDLQPGDYQLDLAAYCEPCLDRTAHAIPLRVRDPALALRIVEAAPNGGTVSQVRLDWVGRPGATYTVRCSSDLETFMPCPGGEGVVPPVDLELAAGSSNGWFFIVGEDP